MPKSRRPSSVTARPSGPASRPGAGWVLGPRRSRSVRAGIAGTLLAHVILLWLAPKFENHFLAAGNATIGTTRTPEERRFDIEIMPEEIPPQTFVESNPDAPDNVPDETDHFSDRNQQLAQEEAAEELGDMPSTEGEDDLESTAIVSGDGADPVPPTPPEPPTPEVVEPTETTEEQSLPALAQDPLSGTEAVQGDNEESYGTNVVKLPENPQAEVAEKVEGVTDPEQASPQGRSLYFRPDPNRPASRPTLAQSQLRPAVFANRVSGTDNIGVAAHNALKTTYGAYFEKIIGVIDQGWRFDIQAKIERRLGFPLDGSRVTVWWTLHKDGSATIDNVEGNAGPLWDGVAVDAIAAPARHADGFGEWSDDMVAVLGESTPIRMTFLYR